jgi:large exoprotein involved in heme utilization and adhesion
MAWELSLFDVSFEAGEDLSEAQFLAVALNSHGKVVKAKSNTLPIGVLQDNPKEGQAANVRMLGISKVVAGGAFAIGDVLTADDDGRLIAASTGDYPIGLALEAAAQAGQVVTAFILPEKKAL